MSLLKVNFEGQKNPQKYESTNDIIRRKVWDFLLIIVECAEFPNGQILNLA